MIGGSGEDRLNGGSGNDLLRGNAGNDSYIFHTTSRVAETDSIDEPFGSGTDSLDFSSSTVSVIVDLDRPLSLATHQGRKVVLVSTNGIDIVRGGFGNDEINGSNTADDQLYGNGGRDILRGRGGNDRLFGGTDVDALYGDLGNDWLEAGTANETAQGGGGIDFSPYKWAIDGTRPDDIRQGGSGTCWFLAALSSVSLKTDLSNRIRYLGDYRFEVTIYHRLTGGLEKQVVFFDGNMATSDPQYGETRNWNGTDECWVILMNRAALQSMQVDYRDSSNAAMAGGFGHEGLLAVTGRRVIQEDGERAGILPDLTDAAYLGAIRNALATKKAVVAGRNQPDNFVVLGRHVYSVLEVSGDRIRIRNPWGVDKQEGTPGTVVTDGNIDDGYVWLSINAFRQVFDYGIAFA